MNGLSTREQKRALHHKTGGAAALSHQSLSTGPGTVYPSEILTLTTTEKLQPILTTDQYLYGNIALLLQVNNPSVNRGTRVDAGSDYIQCVQVIYSIHSINALQNFIQLNQMAMRV